MVPVENYVFANPDGMVQMFEGAIVTVAFLIPSDVMHAFGKEKAVLKYISEIENFHSMEITSVNDSHVTITAKVMGPGCAALEAWDNILAIIHTA